MDKEHHVGRDGGKYNGRSGGKYHDPFQREAVFRGVVATVNKGTLCCLYDTPIIVIGIQLEPVQL